MSESQRRNPLPHPSAPLDSTINTTNTTNTAISLTNDNSLIDQEETTTTTLRQRANQVKQDVHSRMMKFMEALDEFVVQVESCVDAQEAPSIRDMKALDDNLTSLNRFKILCMEDRCLLGSALRDLNLQVNKKRKREATQFARSLRTSNKKQKKKKTSIVNLLQDTTDQEHGVFGLSMDIDLYIAQFIDLHTLLQLRCCCKRFLRTIHAHGDFWPALRRGYPVYEISPPRSRFSSPSARRILVYQQMQSCHISTKIARSFPFIITLCMNGKIKAPWIKQAVLYAIHHGRTATKAKDQLSAMQVAHHVEIKLARSIVKSSTRSKATRQAHFKLFRDAVSHIMTTEIAPFFSLYISDQQIETLSDSRTREHYNTCLPIAHRIGTLYHRLEVCHIKNKECEALWNALTHCSTVYTVFGTVVPPSTLEVHCLDIRCLPKAWSSSSSESTITQDAPNTDTSTKNTNKNVKKNSGSKKKKQGNQNDDASLSVGQHEDRRPLARPYRTVYYYVYLAYGVKPERFVQKFNEVITSTGLTPLDALESISDDPSLYYRGFLPFADSRDHHDSPEQRALFDALNGLIFGRTETELFTQCFLSMRRYVVYDKGTVYVRLCTTASIGASSLYHTHYRGLETFINNVCCTTLLDPHTFTLSIVNENNHHSRYGGGITTSNMQRRDDSFMSHAQQHHPRTMDNSMGNTPDTPVVVE